MSDYNYIYKTLVKGPDDIVGALAYALYKEEKLQFITEFEEKNSREPSDEELACFHQTSNLPARLISYQGRAQGLLEDFLDDVLASELIQQQQAIKDDAVVKAINQKFGFFRGVGQNVVAGFIATAITLGITLGAFLYSEGPARIWAAIFDASPASDEAASIANELEKLQQLTDKNVITIDEFNRLKGRLLQQQ